MAYVIQIVRKIKLSVPQLIHTYLFTMLHTISIVNLTLKLNLRLQYFLNFYYRVEHQYRLCICESFQGGPSYGNFQPAVYSLSQIHSSLLQAESSMTGRTYIGEMLIQIWLKSMKK